MKFHQLIVFFVYLLVLFIYQSSANDDRVDYDEPLILTEYVLNGKYDLGQELSRVHKIPNSNVEIESYSGFFTVDKKFNSNMFFWFFPNQNKKAPLLLYLPGGPGSSCLYSLFVENGPFFVNTNLTLSEREYAWTKEYSVLYIDNPVGTGFSFTDEEGYSKTQDDVDNKLYNALEQFFTLFYQYKSNDFYITGLSYGGKFATSIAYKIHHEPNSIVNFKGIIIFTGFIDPITIFDFGDLFYYFSLINDKQRKHLEQLRLEAIDDIQNERYFEASEKFGEIFFTHDNLLLKYSGINNIFNIMWIDIPLNFLDTVNFLSSPETMKALHVGKQKFQLNLLYRENKVYKKMQSEFMRSVKSKFEFLIENYKVLTFSGQFDLIVPAPSIERFLHSLNWSGKEQFENAERKIWKVDKNEIEISGYLTQYDNLNFFVVRNGGHIPSFDQPRTIYKLITSFINGTLNF